MTTTEAYWEREWAPYAKQICVPLTEKFGTLFRVESTGGNCMALWCQFENGDELLITDANDILSPWTLREKCWRNDRKALGYCVGYYPHENQYGHGGEALGYVIFEKARDAFAVGIAVQACIELAARIRAGLAEQGTELVL